MKMVSRNIFIIKMCVIINHIFNNSGSIKFIFISNIILNNMIRRIIEIIKRLKSISTSASIIRYFFFFGNISNNIIIINRYVRIDRIILSILKLFVSTLQKLRDMMLILLLGKRLQVKHLVQPEQ